MLATFLNKVGTLSLTRGAFLEDFTDKLFYGWSVMLLLMITSLFGMKHAFSKPMSCYVPTHPQGVNFYDYLENYCWSKGTTLVNGKIPESSAGWNMQHNIYYYQWIIFTFAFQAILCYIPRIIWQTICNHTVFKTLLEKQEVDDVVKTYKRLRDAISFKCFIFYYMAIKVLYIGIAILCIFSFQKLVGMNSILFGIFWEEKLFPFETFCKATFHSIGAQNDLAAQCILPNNILYEKIIRYLWFWYALLIILSVVSILFWMFRYALISCGRKSVYNECGYSAKDLSRSEIVFLKVLCTRHGHHLSSDFVACLDDLGENI
jgi:hypothetical protein